MITSLQTFMQACFVTCLFVSMQASFILLLSVEKQVQVAKFCRIKRTLWHLGPFRAPRRGVWRPQEPKSPPRGLGEKPKRGFYAVCPINRSNKFQGATREGGKVEPTT